MVAPAWAQSESFALQSHRVPHPLYVSLVHVPGSDRSAGDALTVYLLDPSFNLSAAIGVAQFLAAFACLYAAPWPHVVLAGVGYASDDPREVMRCRAHDLTPTERGVPAGINLPPLAFGGAAAFLDVVRDEVVPAVEARIARRTRARALVGHSFGGLFALYTLFHDPQAFDAYVAISPSLWWDERIVFRYERNFAAREEPLAAKLFLAVGTGEQARGGGWRNEGFPDDAIAVLRQVDNLREFACTLKQRNYARLQLGAAVLDGEFHLTIFPAAFARGLRWVVEQLAQASTARSPRN